MSSELKPFRCPNSTCGAEYQCETHMGGRMFVCPSCRTVFDIPGGESVMSMAGVPAPPPSRNFLPRIGFGGLLLAGFVAAVIVAPWISAPRSVATVAEPNPPMFSKDDIDVTWRDPEFQALPTAERIAIMSEMDPTFAAMSDVDKRYAAEVTHGVSRPVFPRTGRETIAAKTEERITPSTVPDPDDALPPNGAILAGEVDPSSKHQLNVSNRTGRHAVVILRSVGTSVNTLAFLVHGNQDVFIDGVPDGNYRLIYLFGEGWNQGKGRFRKSAGAWVFDSPSAFWRTTSVTGETRRTEFDVIKITLHTVPNGNATTHQIDEDEFLR